MAKFIVRYDNGTFLGKSRPVATKKAARRFSSKGEAKRINFQIAKMFNNQSMQNNYTVIQIEE